MVSVVWGMARECQRGPDAIAIGNRIRELRQLRGWSQRELAEKLGSHRPIVCRVENGRVGCQSIDTILRYARAFDVTPELITEVLDEPQLLGDA